MSDNTAAVIDLFSGATAGAMCKLVEYPLDTVKTRLQSGLFGGRGALGVMRDIVRNEGAIKGFYAGVSMPMAGCALECAIAFTVFYHVTELMCGLDGFSREADANSYLVVGTAGFAGGVVNGVCLCPFEIIKCRVQSLPGKYPTARKCIAVSVREEGPRVMFSGLSATMAREVPGSVGFFVALETAMRTLFPQYREPGEGNNLIDSAPWYVRPICGGFAGLGLLGPTYCVDTIKTAMQIDPAFARLGIVGTARHIHRSGGVRAFYTGFSITMMRGFLGNGLVFTVYDLVADLLLRAARPESAVDGDSRGSGNKSSVERPTTVAATQPHHHHHSLVPNLHPHSHPHPHPHPHPHTHHRVGSDAE